MKKFLSTTTSKCFLALGVVSLSLLGGLIYAQSSSTIPTLTKTTWENALSRLFWKKQGASVNYTGGNVGIGVPNPQVKLDVKGAIRVGNTTASANIAGLMRYNEGTKCLEVADGNKWKSLCPVVDEYECKGEYTSHTNKYCTVRENVGKPDIKCYHVYVGGSKGIEKKNNGEKVSFDSKCFGNRPSYGDMYGFGFIQDEQFVYLGVPVDLEDRDSYLSNVKNFKWQCPLNGKCNGKCIEKDYAQQSSCSNFSKSGCNTPCRREKK